MNNPDFEINLNNSTVSDSISTFEVENSPVEINIELNGGARGLKGEKGDTGAKGDTGDTGPQGIPGVSPTVTTSKEDKTTTITITDINGTHTATIEDGLGDMEKSVYDTNNNGVVDNAEKVNNHTVEKDVPSNAEFTDTTYTAGSGISISEDNVISNTQTSAEWGNIIGTLSNQTDLQTALNNKANVSDIPDVSNFITKTVDDLTNYYLKSETYTKQEVNTLIGNIDQFKVEVVQTLPTSDIDEHTIYFVPKAGTVNDVYDEYLYINNSWELIGNTQVDLTNYYTKTETNTLLGGKQDTLVSGTNIKTINNTTLLGSGNIDTSEVSIGTTQPTGNEEIWVDPTDTLKYKYNGQWFDLTIKALDGMPIGFNVLFSGPDNKIPTGWMLCDGRAISRTTYSELFDLIGTTYGVGDGSTTFNIPNLKGKVPVGLNIDDEEFDVLGKTGGEKEHTLIVGEIPAHNHKIKLRGGNNSDGGAVGFTEGKVYGQSNSFNNYQDIYMQKIGSDQPHNNLQPYIVQNYIIKVKNTTPTMASIEDDYNTSTTDGYSSNYVNEHSLTVSDTEPTNKTKMWVQTSDNLFDSSNANILNALLRTGGDLHASASERTLYIECQPNTTYQIIKKEGKRFRIDERSSTPTLESSNVNLVYNDKDTQLNYTTSANGNYLLINYFCAEDTDTESTILNSISITVLPTINKLNRNNTYDEIYSKEVILYSSDGSTGNITLNETAANFNYIEILYKNSDNYFSSTKVYNGVNASLTISYYAGGSYWFNSKVVSVNGTSITNKNYAIGWIGSSNSCASSNTNSIKIYKVLGYK